MTRSRPCPSHPAPAPRPTLLQPEEGLVQLLHLAEVQQPRLLTARHGSARPSGAPAAPGLSVRGGRGEPCRGGTDKTPRVSGDPRQHTAAQERLTPPAALTCSPVPGERGHSALQAGRRGAMKDCQTELSDRAQPCPGRGPPPAAPRSSSRPTARPGPQPELQGCPREGEV